MLLEVDAIAKSFGGVAAVDGATFAVEEGSITALIGPNGAGKTTVFNLVSGFMKPDRGRIGFAGRRIEGLSGDRVARAGLVRIFQTARALTRMTVLENMMLAARHQPGERLGAAWLIPGGVARREAQVRRQAEECLELVRLAQLRDEYAGNLSGGQRKLLELGRALMVEPRMILLDEPMAGVAPVLRDQLLDHIAHLRSARGVTVLVIEHDMEVVMSISERVIVMDEGRVIADGPPEAIQTDERVIEAYLGRSAAAEAGATA
jgi:ABC-type branched-subunit amino acid transport system ATPase component